MSNSVELEKTLKRIEAGVHTAEDLAALRRLLKDDRHQVIQQLDGKYNVNIKEGRDIQIGDRIYVSWDDEAVQALIQVIRTEMNQKPTPEIPLNDLVQQARSAASAKVVKLFGKIRLLNKREIEVDRLYVDLYLLEMQEFHATISGLLAEQDVRGQFDRLGIGRRGERSQGLAIASSEAYPRLMVLGKPGLGKSTFLRHLAVGCAKGTFLGDYIPILLELRDVNEATFRLFELIHRELGLEQKSQTEQILRQGRGLILLDGLDEVSIPLRLKVQTELRKFVRQYDRNRFILTCRTQTTEYIPESFQAVEVADFKPEQVECFALNWFTAMADSPEQGIEMKEHFMAKLRENPQTAELAVTPVLLSLTCWIFDDLKRLPEKRSDLYQKGLNLLLQQWDEGRGISRDSGSDRYQKLTVEERKQLLSYVAVRKFEQAENFVLFEESEICSYISEHLQISAGESREVLGAIAQHHGLLIERARGIRSFSHLTFQEYFVARWFCEQKLWGALAEKVNLSHWREVFVLTPELCSHISKLLKLMKKNIDESIGNDEDLQLFLSRVYKKSKSLVTPFHSAKIRAFYFNINRNNILDLDDVFGDAVDQSFNLNYKSVLNKQYAPECAFDCRLSLLLYEAYWLNAINRNIDYSVGGQAIISRLNEIQEWKSFDEELVSRIQELGKRLPIFAAGDWLSEGWDTFKTWWREDGRDWAEQLRELLVKHRSIRYDLEFLRDEQWKLLQQYYSANELLITCLNSKGEVRNDVRKEIEGTLLLPLTEIEKRKKQSVN
jgi:predicted NACHT family NTPase